jgi:ketosteroid isomerase-like protein
MKSTVSILFLVASCLASADAVEDVRCREIGFSRAAESRDSARFAAHIDADARFVGTSVARGLEEIVTAWSQFFEAGGPEIIWRPQFVEVLEDGRLALTRGPYRVSVRGDDGSQVEHWGTFNSVWRLGAGGEWKVVFDAGNGGKEPPSDEVRALLDAPDLCDAKTEPAEPTAPAGE